jgi:hypothetical protein
MDTLKDLLLKKNLDQPSEMKSIQVFLERELGFPFTLTDFPKHTTVAVGNGKIAYLLRTKLPALESFAAPTKKIHVRIDRKLET